MTIQIYNSLGRKKEDFVPLQDKQVKMYVCGPTVYDLLHVGNFRGAIIFNLVRNWLEAQDYKVTYVYNYTDVDDKIIKRANEDNVDPNDIAETYIKEFETDFARLNLTPHDYNPRCTHHIPEMVEFVKSLVDKGVAYEVDGEVFYSIEKFSGYGKLSGKNIEDLQAGHRVEADPRKKNPMDFVLWKPSKDGEPSWDSPWGAGRPGWHLECSVMNKCLHGDSIDIHGGGIDLTFPHHENEIAQSEAATGQPFAKYWMHNNFINFGDEKMSKSLGNVVKGRDFMDKYHPEVLKYLILSVHYRSILNLTEDNITNAMQGLARIYHALRMADIMAAKKGDAPQCPQAFQDMLNASDIKMAEALNDDFNTPNAFAVIFDVVRTFNATWKLGEKITPEQKSRALAFQQWMKGWGKLLALFQESPQDLLKRLDEILIVQKGLDPAQIEQLISDRNQARKDKDFQKADLIRDQLLDMDILIQDSPEGTIWEVKKS